MYVKVMARQSSDIFGTQCIYLYKVYFWTFSIHLCGHLLKLMNVTFSFQSHCAE